MGLTPAEQEIREGRKRGCFATGRLVATVPPNKIVGNTMKSTDLLNIKECVS